VVVTVVAVVEDTRTAAVVAGASAVCGAQAARSRSRTEAAGAPGIGT
jgi:hypothetical protein